MGKRASAITIKNVAQQAGVSKATVSKYLTGRPYVSQETAARIQAAIDDLNFKPNGLARSLVTRRTDMLGVVVANIGNPFYTDLVQAIDAEARSLGFNIILAQTDRDPSRERDLVQAMQQKGVDGLIFASVHMDDVEVVRLKRSGVNLVLASRYLTDADIDSVTVDSVKGAWLVVDYLINLGHRRIAHLAGPESVLPIRDRKEGYLAALREANVPSDKDLIVHGSTGFDAGRAGLSRLLELPRDRRPTAIFTCNDLVALGVLEEARNRGLEIPEDLSVAGFDNISFGAISRVPLTTIDSSIGELGRRAVRMLAERLDAKDKALPPRYEVLQPHLLVRGSTARAPAPLKQP
jgi:LacI family transcriptional regulator